MRIYDETRPMPTLRKTVVFPRRDERPAANSAAPVKEKLGTLAAKAVNITIKLDPAEFFAARIGDRLAVQSGALTLSAKLNPKSVKKVRAAIGQHGAEHVVVLVQGQLRVGNMIESAGLSAIVKSAERISTKTHNIPALPAGNYN